jgi:hypothetical protein
MALSQCLAFDPASKTLVGGKQPVDNAFIDREPRPSGQFVGNFLKVSASELILASLDGAVNLPVGTDFEEKGGSGKDLVPLLIDRCLQIQLCSTCLARLPEQGNVLHLPNIPCTSFCKGSILLLLLKLVLIHNHMQTVRASENYATRARYWAMSIGIALCGLALLAS